VSTVLQRLEGAIRALSRALSALARRAWVRLRVRARWASARSRLAARLRRLRPLAARATGVVLASLCITAAGAAVVAVTTERVPATRIGVRRSLLGGGIEERDYAPGLYASILGWHAWDLLDARTQLCVFAPQNEGGYFPRLHVRTKDGNSAEVAVTVAYRIRPGHAHAVVRDGLRNAYRKQARVLSEKVLLAAFAELSSEDLMSTGARTERSRSARERLDEELARFHLEALAVRISGVQFPPAFEAKLQEKQLTEQSALMARAAAEVESELEPARLQKEIEVQVQRVEAEMDRRIAELRATNDRALAALELETQRYANERENAGEAAYTRAVAAGERAVLAAEALREELVGTALRGEGGRLWLAREAARNLRLERVTLNSNDPRVPLVLDLDELVDLIVPGE